MRTVVDQLAQYAEYHRDKRNIATHFIGIPMIVFSVATMLSRPSFMAFGVPLSLAVVPIVLTILFYLRLDLRLGLFMAVFMTAAGALGALVAAQATSTWLAVGLGSFVVGWIIQFIGHGFEGRKPAFVDDLIGLIVGPLFVVAEAGFLLGLRDELRVEVERRAGPTRSGRNAPAKP